MEDKLSRNGLKKALCMLVTIVITLVVEVGSSQTTSSEGPPIPTLEGTILTRELSLTVEKGDTLSELFGQDLMKVVKKNQRLISSPHRIGAGIEITIPAYTYLSPKAVERLNRLAQIEKEAVRSIERAKRTEEEAALTGAATSGGEAYAEGVELLNKARELVEEGNFLAGRETADEAAMQLEMSAVIANQTVLQAQVERMEDFRKAASALHRTPNRAFPPGWSVYVLLLTLVFLILAILRRRSRSSRRRQAARRLKWHLDRLRELEGAR